MEDLDFILICLCAVITIANSQKQRVNTQKLQVLSSFFLLRIVEKFLWAMISPSVHRILSHGCERILMNGGFGLGAESEEGIEALNKWIKMLSEKGFRKTNT